MADIVTKSERSKIMSRIRSKNTKPEMKIRKALHKLGFRYRIHNHNLPGKPDIVLKKYRTIIQVKGCFWHGHSCRDGHIPKSRQEYWKPKLKKNKDRDLKNEKKLKELGWNLIVLWECNCRTDDMIKKEVSRIVRILLSGIG